MARSEDIQAQLCRLTELLGGQQTLKHLKILKASAEFLSRDEILNGNDFLPLKVITADSPYPGRRVRARRG